MNEIKPYVSTKKLVESTRVTMQFWRIEHSTLVSEDLEGKLEKNLNSCQRLTT